jgi:glycogen debranching enzyme
MQKQKIDYLNILENQIDISRVPFSDRGSRLLLMQYPQKSSLYIKLAERLTQLDANNEAYLKRSPFIHNLELIDQNSHPLEFSITTRPDILKLHTRLGDYEIVFLDQQTIAFGLPSNQICGIRFRAFPQYWRNTEHGGKFLSIRNLSYNTTGAIVSNQITPVEGGYEVEFLINSGEDCTLAIDIYPAERSASSLQPFSALRGEAEQRWRTWFERVPKVKEKYISKYAYAWWVMANNLVSPQGKLIYEAMTPSKLGYVGLWLWDSALHALAYRYVDPVLARNQIRSMLAHQLPNGMVPDAVFDDGIVSTINHPIFGEVTKPPILAWAAIKLHEAHPDLTFLSEIYVPLVRLNAWWLSMNDDDGDGLAQYNHPYSSGLDNSPLWDEGMPVESPDLNTYLCIQMTSLAQIAEALNMTDEAAMWRRRATALVAQMIKHFWDAEAGYFWVLKEHQPIKTVTPFNLYPLWTGQLPTEISQRLLEHLRDPKLFWGKFMLPTVAKNDPHYDPESMWRGPIWANINYFFIEALQNLGESQMVSELRERTLELIQSQEDMYEYYNSQTGKPPATAVNLFGWTAAIFIDLAIQASQKQPSPKKVENHEK